MGMRKILHAIVFLTATVYSATAQNVLFPANPGDMIVKGATTWGPVPGGTAGCVLRSNGPTAAPTWQCSLPLNFQLPPMAVNTVWCNISGAQAPATACTISQILNTIDYDIQRPPLAGSVPYVGTDNTWHLAPPSAAGWVWTTQGTGVIPRWAPANNTPFPPGAAGTCLVSNGVGVDPSYQACAGAVASVFGRTGTVTAQTGDYTVGQVTNALSNVLASGYTFVGNASNVATATLQTPTVLSPTDPAFGALCDGATDDTAAFVALGAAMTSAISSRVEMPDNANCRVWPTAASILANPILMAPTNVKNSTVNFNGATIQSAFSGISFSATTLGTTTVNVTTAGLGLVAGMSVQGTDIPAATTIVTVNPTNIIISAAATGSSSPTLKAYPITASVFSWTNSQVVTINDYRVTLDVGRQEYMALIHNALTNTQWITFNGGLATGGTTTISVQRPAGSATARSKYIYTTLESADVYYPITLFLSGDYVSGTVKSSNAGRPAIAHGVIGFNPFIHAVNATSQLLLVAYGVDNDAGEMQGKVYFTDKGSTTGGGIIPLELRSRAYDGAAPTARAKMNVELNIDMDQTTRTYDTILATDSLNSAGAIASYPADWNVVISGNVTGNTTTAFMNLGLAAGGFGSTINAQITLRDIMARDMTRALNVGGAAGSRISIQNVFTASSTITPDVALTANALLVSGFSGANYTTNIYTNNLSADVALSNTGTYFDGPTVAQGTSGTWFAVGTIALQDSGAAATFICKLWDGTTEIAAAARVTGVVGETGSLSLSGFITSPVGNIRISCRDFTATTGFMLSSITGVPTSSKLNVMRVNN